MTELNQKFTKMLNTTWEKDICKNLGVKEGGKCLLNANFRELMVIFLCEKTFTRFLNIICDFIDSIHLF